MTETGTSSTWSFRRIATIVLVALILVALGFGGYVIGTNLNSSNRGSQADATLNAEDPDSPNAAKQKDNTQQENSGAFPKAVGPQPDEATREFLKSLAHREADYPFAYGKTDAPVVMSVFTDMSCPMCSQLQLNTMPSLKPLVDNGTLRVQYFFNPIFADQYRSDIGAFGGIAAAKQGKFFEYLHVQANQPGHVEWNEQIAKDIAKQAGVADLNKFSADLKSTETQDILYDHAMLAQQRLGLNGTPAIVINDRAFSGAQPIDIIQDTIFAAKADVEAAS